jgi:putative membrane protein
VTRSELIGVGVVLIVLAVAGYITPMSVTLAESRANLTIPQVVAVCNSGFGQIGQMLPQVALVCSQYNTFMFGIYGAGLIGIILIIVGAVVSGKDKELIYNVDTGKTKYRSIENEDESLDILKKRYAQGEITKEEFEDKKKDLENS